MNNDNKLPTMTPEEFILIRQKFELTREELAELMGESPRLIRRWENGEKVIKGPVTVFMKMIDRHGVNFLKE